MAEYRAAVIGHTGRGNYGHGLDTVYRALDNVEVVAVADADADGLASAGERLDVAAAGRYSDYREMLDKESVDIVSVCPRWVGEHHDMVIAAANSGARAIYSEKSFAQTLRQADEMIAACDANGVMIAVAHQNRFHPHIIKMAEMIKAGEIGAIREVHGYGKQDHRGGGEDLVVLGTHIFDLMRLFAGDPRWVEAAVLVDGEDAAEGNARDGAEEVGLLMGDSLRAMYGFGGGVLGTFVSRREGKHFGVKSMGIQVEGTDGILTFRGDYLMHHPNGLWTPAPSDDGWRVIGEPSAVPGGITSLNVPLVRDLIDAMENGRQPQSSAVGARWSLEMILGVYAAHRNGRTALPTVDRDHPLRGWETGAA